MSSIAEKILNPDHEFLLMQAGNISNKRHIESLVDMGLEPCPLPIVNGQKSQLKKHGRNKNEGIYLIWGEGVLPRTPLYIGQSTYLRIRLQQHWNGKNTRFWHHLCNWLIEEGIAPSNYYEYCTYLVSDAPSTPYSFDYFVCYPTQIWLMPGSTRKERVDREMELRYLFKPVLNHSS